MPKTLEKAYQPNLYENKIYHLWEKSGFFNPDHLPARHKKPFCMVMPPPNANGALHIGHAVFVTLQDVMIRFRRMQGFRTLWLPGADHAGFETQVVFDKKLEKEGRRRSDIPREKLYLEILEFTLKNKKVMESQLKKLGASCDFSRKKFTLDPEIIKIVYQTFEELKKDGLVYKGERIVNWCTKHQTSLSDVEVKWMTKQDPLYYIRYGPLWLATVRPETKFGDTGVAVNPKDKRYQKYIGKEIEIETLLGKAKIKVIADSAVDMRFGTGVVKVTPAHDPADFEIWSRHKSEIPGPLSVIDRFGRLTEKTGRFQGLSVMEARLKVVEELTKRRLLDPKKTDPNYTHNLAICYKCSRPIEPLILKNQWFLKMAEKPLISGKKSLRDLAVSAVKSGKIKFIPKRFEKIFFHWMKNLRDWNISRQIAWGIRIPVWHCQNFKSKLAGLQTEKRMGFAGWVTPQVFNNKTKTYRLRDHKFKVSDRVIFEDSSNGKPFGTGTITDVKQTSIGKIDLKDKQHYKTYKKIEELIAAFKKHYPEKKVTPNTRVWIYTYQFEAMSECEPIIAIDKKPKKCPQCGSVNLVQETDVFDTWFSSGQWPFATLKTGRPSDFKTFYPTDVMETGWDILFFWVARMIMLGLYVTGKIPFRYVYLHGLVRDKERQKMSKSKGNVIDPLGVIELYGADALRMALLAGNTPGNDPIIYEEKIRGYQHFANKVWNAARFVLMNLDQNDYDDKPLKFKKGKIKLSPADKKIINDLSRLKKTVTLKMESFKFYQAVEKLYHYFWHIFCDKIIEKKKAALALKDEKGFTARILLLKILLENLKMLHPFMPFVTEAIYQNLPLKKKKLLMVERW